MSSPASEDQTKSAARPSTRFDALDVLRGLAILGMAFSGMVPYRTLPAWMYHAQLPPPTRDFNPNIFGLTWVDLVFPFFLFSMGAAIPIALGRQLARGVPVKKVLLGLFSRGLLLAIYALLGGHFRPFSFVLAPDLSIWILTLDMFVVICLVLLRWPEWVPTLWRRIGTGLGWSIVAVLLVIWQYPDDTQGFANYRNDIILMVLANVAVSGGIIWLATRNPSPQSWAIRIFAVAIVAAIFLTSTAPNSLGKLIWDFDPISWVPGRSGRFVPILYHFAYHKYLMIVLPGTIAGDAITRYLKDQTQRALSPAAWSPWTTRAIAAAGPALILLNCIGLQARAVPLTAVLDLALLATLLWFTQAPGSAEERLLSLLTRLGSALLTFGLFVEPVGGGIRKDDTTLSYFFVAGGLAAFLLGSLTIYANAKPISTKRPIWTTLAGTGANAILAYLVITNLVWGLVGVTGLENWVAFNTQDPILLTAYAGLKTIFVALVTCWATNRNLFLRA